MARESGKSSKIRQGIARAAVIAAVACASAAHAQGGAVIQLKVAGSDAINSATPFFAAQTQGYFKEVGLEVTYLTMGGGAAPMAAALKRSEIDMALGAAAQYMGDIGRGVISGKLIGEFTDNNYVILGGNGITDIRQLKGKLFGISSYNAGDQLYAQAVLAHYGVKSDDLTWLPLGIPAARLSALLSGRVDGIEMVLTSMPESAKSKIILTADDSPVPFVSNAIFVRQAQLNSNRPALQKFLAAVGKGAVWVRQNPQEAMKACALSGASEAACKIAIDVATTAKSPYTWSATTKLNRSAIETMIPMVMVDIPQGRNMKVEDFADFSLTP